MKSRDLMRPADWRLTFKPTLNRGIQKGGPQLADRAETADHIHKDATDRYAPCLRALLLFARPIINIGDFYYCVVLPNIKCNTEWYYLYLKNPRNKLKC